MDENIPDSANEISQSVSSIIGSPTSLVPKKATSEDHQREKFERIIRTLEEVNARSIILNVDLGMNMNKYDEKFYDIVDSLISLIYPKNIAELIFFYVYDRLNPDGSVNELIDEQGNSVLLRTPADLWAVIQSITKSRKPRKKN